MTSGHLLHLWPATLPRLTRTRLAAVGPVDVERLRRTLDPSTTDEERSWVELVGALHRHDIEVTDAVPVERTGSADIELADGS